MGKNILHEDHLEEWKRDQIDAKRAERLRFQNLVECAECKEAVRRDESHVCEHEGCEGRFCENCCTVDDDGLWWCPEHRDEGGTP